MTWESRLQTMDSAYAEASDAERLDVGTYDTTVVSSKVTDVSWSPDLQWQLVFEAEEGRRTEHLNIERENMLWKAKGFATKLGYDGPLSGLLRWAPVATGAKCRIEIKQTTKDDKTYTNTFLREVLSPGTGKPLADSEIPGGVDPMDDIPF